jgi:hypothetical protein
MFWVSQNARCGTEVEKDPLCLSFIGTYIVFYTRFSKTTNLKFDVSKPRSMNFYDLDISIHILYKAKVK